MQAHYKEEEYNRKRLKTIMIKKMLLSLPESYRNRPQSNAVVTSVKEMG
jgi:hypothetical protein